MNLQQVGLYAWGGPGTIRLLNVKYHSPRVDEASFMSLYEPTYLEEARHKLGVTDMWVTYSWGFADHTEQVDRQYIVERLPHFRQQGIGAYAYIQGLNVVASEFRGKDIFCQDHHGQLLPYSKGRALTCPNKPAARQLILERVQAASQEDFKGIFVDNILFGLPPFYLRRDYTSFFGCACKDCRQAFQEQFGYPLSFGKLTGHQQLIDYLAFRCQTVFALLKDLSETSRAAGKQFGINLYDPYWYTPQVYFGYDIAQIAPLLDYNLVENYALHPVAGINNQHLGPLLGADTQKPTFVVSYRKGIGYDGAFGQSEVNTIWSEAKALGYAPCLKATEYKTKGTWHALDLATLQAPTLTPSPQSAATPKPLATLPISTSSERYLVNLVNRYYTRLAHMSFENRLVAGSLERLPLMASLFRKARNYNLHPSSSGVM